MLAFAIYSKYLCLDMQLDELFEYNKTLRLFAFGMPYIKHAVSFMRENVSHNSCKTSKLGVCCAVVFFFFSKNHFFHHF